MSLSMFPKQARKPEGKTQKGALQRWRMVGSQRCTMKGGKLNVKRIIIIR